MALRLGDGVERLPGIGPARARSLEKLGLATVEDLLRYSEYGWRERRIATLLARRYPVALTEADVRKLRRLGQKKLRQA